MTDVAAQLALTGTTQLAEEPTTWAQGSDMSLLTALLLFVGVPLLIIAVITLMVMAPSLAKGPRYRPGADTDDASEWFGVLPGSEDASQLASANSTPQRQLASTATDERLTDEDTGGASARW